MLTVSTVFYFLLLFFLGFDVMLKGGGNKFYLNKSPELIARSNLTFMTWFGLSDITANVTLFHSKGLNVRIQNDLFIEKDVR